MIVIFKDNYRVVNNYPRKANPSKWIGYFIVNGHEENAYRQDLAFRSDLLLQWNGNNWVDIK